MEDRMKYQEVVTREPIENDASKGKHADKGTQTRYAMHR
jgi:hypothetical protein